MVEPPTKPATSASKKRPASHNNNHNNNHNRNKSHDRKRRRRGASSVKGVSAEAPKSAVCSICSDSEKPSNYKCPKCRAVYCSVACCKEHKLICPQKPPEATAVLPASSNLKDVAFASLNLPQRKPRVGRRSRYDNDDNNEEDDSLSDELKLTDDMKRAVEQSDWLRTQLQADGGLRNVIRQIAESRNVENLQHVQQRFPNFQVFLDKLLVVAGVLERGNETHEEAMEPLDEWLERDWSQDPVPPHLHLKSLRRTIPKFEPVDYSSSSEDKNDKDEDSTSSVNDSSDESDA